MIANENIQDQALENFKSEKNRSHCVLSKWFPNERNN